jgi:hypothetical protein
VFTGEYTFLHVAVMNWTTDRTASLESATGSYLVDDQGTPYYVQEEMRVSQDVGLQQQGPFFLYGEILPRAVERLVLSFPSMSPTGSFLFKHPQFPSITIYKYKHGPSTITFCRPARFYGALVGADILDDGKVLAELSNGASAVVEVQAGEHTFQVRFGGLIPTESSPSRFNMLPGEKYYFRTESKAQAFRSLDTLTPVPTEEECKKP